MADDEFDLQEAFQALLREAAEDPYRREDGTHPFAYRCSICDGLYRPDNVGAHMREEKAKPTWPGFMSWDFVGEEFYGDEVPS